MTARHPAVNAGTLEHPGDTFAALGDQWCAQQTDLIDAMQAVFGGPESLLRFWPTDEHPDRPHVGEYLFGSDRHGYVLFTLAVLAWPPTISRDLPRLFDRDGVARGVCFQAPTLTDMLVQIADESRLPLSAWNRLHLSTSCRWFSNLLAEVNTEDREPLLALLALRRPDFLLWWNRHLVVTSRLEMLDLAEERLRAYALRHNDGQQFAYPEWLIAEHPNQADWDQAIAEALTARQDLLART